MGKVLFLPMEQIIAVGDADNDESMIHEAGISQKTTTVKAIDSLGFHYLTELNTLS